MLILLTEPQSCFVIPLRSKGKVRGVMFVARPRSRLFTSQDVTLLTALSRPIASAIENARLYEKVADVAILEERDRIAREIHDGLAQVLGFITLKVANARELVAANKRSLAQDELQNVERVAQDAYVEAREAILDLKTTIAPDGGLMNSLSEYLRRFVRQSGIQTHLVAGSEEPLRFLPSTEIQLIRIIQEALTNVRKHAHAQRAWVRFSTENGHLKVVIEDDGQGFDLAQVAQGEGHGFGLQTMRDRAESVGGSFKVETAPGGPTKVIVTLPLRPTEGYR
ncbi:MAG: GAF domain-containing sensor histidine kinase, partial [Chloroflexi bacterium]|nr:GAF domain-containing sensor histidine kinase [Chloroflexota bacterium]